jgi:excisionase family DNA binding protein
MRLLFSDENPLYGIKKVCGRSNQQMEKVYLNVDELSQYLGIKKSNLYSKVERKEIPFYRVGRLIFFKRDEIDTFMDKCRVECFDINKEAQRVMKGANRSRMDIGGVIKKTIEGVNGKGYTTSHGKPDQVKGLRKEVQDGTL